MPMLRNVRLLFMTLIIVLCWPLGSFASHKIPREVKRLRTKTRSHLSVAPKLQLRNPKTHTVRNYFVRREMFAVMQTGSMRMNIQRLAKIYGWPTVVWSLPNDYNWLGKTRVHANSLPSLLRHILTGYPLQAVFYQGNHILVIKPRTLQ
ncbi:MAG: toxin co-regulated pilus biosynthesis Q family protein [Gammaproteobacteria bacterium]|nr:toxin co-regulated pilus biosynthesis Q family protein [Gammaproteobacteria bacterium]